MDLSESGSEVDTLLTADNDWPFKLGPLLTMDDPKLIKFIRQHVLVPPSNLPYNMTFKNFKDLSDVRRHTSRILVPKFFSFPEVVSVPSSYTNNFINELSWQSDLSSFLPLFVCIQLEGPFCAFTLVDCFFFGLCQEAAKFCPLLWGTENKKNATQ